MKILYVITGLGGGGAEKVVADLADQMLKKGHEVKVAYLKGQVVVGPESQAIELVYLGLESLKNVKKAYQTYKNLLQNFKPDVVHAHMVHANIFARLSRIFFPIPKLICTAHSNNEGGKTRMLAYRATHHLSDLTTNVSRSASERFEALGAVPKGEIQTVYNGINLEKFKKDVEGGEKLRASLGIRDNEFALLAVGRLHEAKDYPNLLEALSIVLKRITSERRIKLIIAGDGEEKNRLEAKIKLLELQDYVCLIGRRNDIPQLMSMADLFVLSSSFEGFGLVVAEAMACETFVIATDCGGVKEVMGEYGILVQAKNVEALANALYHAITQDHLKIAFNNNAALNYVKETFALEQIVNQWIDIYEK